MGGVKAITSSHIPKTDVSAKFRSLRERMISYKRNLAFIGALVINLLYLNKKVVEK